MARFPAAHWRGPVPNESPGRMGKVLGLVLHVEQGSEAGTDSWFHRPGAEASAHFGNPKTGPLDQWVDTADMAWAEEGGNPRWISVEHEGHAGDELTASQLENDAQLLAWLTKTAGVFPVLSDDPARGGLGWHGMGGASWGGHLDCPGEPIKAARPQIIARAREILGAGPATEEEQMQATMTPTKAGTWRVHSNGTVFTAGDAQYFGGYPDLPAAEREGERSFVAIECLGATVEAGYVLLADDGAAYRFTPAVWANLQKK